MENVTVIGAGLAGCEAAWKLARHGIAVTLWEMRPEKTTPAHKTADFAELVCSNSLKAARLETAAGLLKEEMRRLGSLTMAAAELCSVPAGGALAVDRAEFSRIITRRIEDEPLITVRRGELTGLPEEGVCVVATGPLTSDALAEELRARFGGTLSFYDAVAPIVSAESLDEEKVFMAARWGHGDPDYVNCPMNKEEYEAFLDALLSAERAELHEFDKVTVYEGCMPVEIMAGRGRDALRYGPMRPVGLTDPRTGHRPWANVQLRRENAAGSMYNMVGFQTNLKWSEQRRVFSMIPGLGHADFLRYGVMHRDTFIDSPRLLTASLALKAEPRVFFAGQLTGVEGYIESAASGQLAGENAARRVLGMEPLVLPPDTMLGGLVGYITNPAVTDFQPMGSNMGLLPPLETRIRGKQERYAALADRALESLAAVL